MKKITALLLAIMLSVLAMAGIASAASPKPPVTVWVGEQKLAFDVPPLSAGGTTYVEFKALFTALGYSVAYDAARKTVTWTSESVIMTLNASTGAATVNGKATQQQVKLILQNGHTLVPIRFVGESTGLNVDWNAEKQTVHIDAEVSTDADVKGIQAFLAKMDAYDSSERDGILSLIEPGSELYQALKAQGDPGKGKAVSRTTSQLLKIDSISPTSAVITASQHAVKVSGFYLDNDCVIQLMLVRGQDKQWKIRSTGLLQFNYVNTDEILSQEADVPAVEKTKILAVIDDQVKASADKDIDALKATLDPDSPNLYAMLNDAQSLMDTYDLSYTTETARIVDYTNDQAKVYLVQTIKKLAGPEFTDSRISVVATLRKTADGHWVDIGQIQVIQSEPLQS